MELEGSWDMKCYRCKSYCSHIQTQLSGFLFLFLCVFFCEKWRCLISEDQESTHPDETELDSVFILPWRRSRISERQPRSFVRRMKKRKQLWSTLINLKNAKTKKQTNNNNYEKKKKKKRACNLIFPFWEKYHFICDPGESRYEPGALMKRAEYPANTLTGPRWLLGDKAKWLLSDLVCLSTAALHLWLRALLLSG